MLEIYNVISTWGFVLFMIEGLAHPNAVESRMNIPL